jgi:hypothetical protein
MDEPPTRSVLSLRPSPGYRSPKVSRAQSYIGEDTSVVNVQSTKTRRKSMTGVNSIYLIK